MFWDTQWKSDFRGSQVSQNRQETPKSEARTSQPQACADLQSRSFSRWGGSPYPLVMTNSLLLKMAIEIVDFPNKSSDFP